MKRAVRLSPYGPQGEKMSLIVASCRLRSTERDAVAVEASLLRDECLGVRLGD